MKSFDEVLCLFKDALPIGETLPKSQYAKKLKKGLGFTYNKIHASPNDYVLF